MAYWGFFVVPKSPPALAAFINDNARCAARTRDLQFRKPVLYPTELIGLVISKEYPTNPLPKGDQQRGNQRGNQRGSS